MNKYEILGDKLVVVDCIHKTLEYDEDTLNHLHKVALMVLNDFTDICEKNNIDYFVAFGTALGAVRHEGFIPWDDDIDVMMFREDYEKFSDIMKNNKEKYELLSTVGTEKFYRLYTKMNLKDTFSHEMADINCDFKMGISLDIFILDNVPKNKFKKWYCIKKCRLLKKLTWTLEITNRDYYLSENKQRIGHAIKKLLKIFHINQKFLKKHYRLLQNINEDSDECYELSACYNLKIFPKNIFYPPKKMKFENIMVNVPNDYDKYLTIIYGDYMKLPPIEERVNHSYEIDFGPY